MQIKKKLLDAVRDKVRLKHYSLSTEKTYIHWIKHYIFYHNKKHPIEMAKPEIETFLTHLAVERKVSPTTQNQAFSALLFLYKEVLGIDMSEWNIQALRAQESKGVRGDNDNFAIQTQKQAHTQELPRRIFSTYDCQGIGVEPGNCSENYKKTQGDDSISIPDPIIHYQEGVIKESRRVTCVPVTLSYSVFSQRSRQGKILCPTQ